MSFNIRSLVLALKPGDSDDIFVNIEDHMLAITGKASECKIPEAPSDSEAQQLHSLRLHIPSPLMELDDCVRFGTIEPPILGLIPPKQTEGMGTSEVCAAIWLRCIHSAEKELPLKDI